MVSKGCIIEVEGLHTRFGSHVVHEDINLCVHRGEVLALVGGSGAGKTALMREMLGLDMPAQGMVRVSGNLCRAMTVKQPNTCAIVAAFCSRKAHCSARYRYMTTSPCPCVS